MTLKFFNTLTKKKEVFKEINPKQVRMYTCGPTVYAPPHIGNYRSFLVADLIRRYLEYKGYKVKQVMNITDIDDKTIRDSGKEGLSLKEFTEKYEKIFFEGIDLLNIKRASVYVRATENVEEMIKITRALIEKGFAYERLGSVYYDISKFKDYGKLSGLDLSKIKIGARVEADEYAKDNPQDFVLMKKSTTEELKRGIYYKTEWGPVRPGWHIECSAISMKYLGETFDIHTGGVDLIFPHHENEIAQSEAYTGKKFVNYWLHGEYLLVEGQKMAKSLGNFITLKDLIDKGYDPKAIRYLLISTHYKQPLNFTFKALESAQKTVENLFDFIERLKEVKGKKENKTINDLIKEIKRNFEESMDDNLDINTALANMFDFIRQINKFLAKEEIGKKNADAAIKLMLGFDKVFGLGLGKKKEEKLTEEAKLLIEQREKARKKGNYKTADEIRKRLKDEFGIILEDTKKGVKWKKIK